MLVKKNRLMILVPGSKNAGGGRKKIMTRSSLASSRGLHRYA
jgi:hypothetical protein